MASLADILNLRKEEDELFTPMSEQNMSVQPQPEPELPPAPEPVASAMVPEQQEGILRAAAAQQAPEMPEQEDMAPEKPMTVQEQLLADYRKLLGSAEEDRNALQEARRTDRLLKTGGAIGDALATMINARSQMSAKVPGVKVQQGAGLGKIADMFATAPEVASDVAGRREQLLKQYAELAKGERSQLDRDLKKRQIIAYEAQTKAQAKKAESSAEKETSKAAESKPSFEEKETIKANIKERLEESKENRKLKKELEPAIASVNDQIKNVEDALNLIDKSKLVGTGPFDQYFAGATPEGQLLKKALGNISLDTLVQKFQGMSRAIDTETDRKFFQETQPSMGNFETTNKKMLNDILTRLKGIKAKSEAKLQEIESQKEPESQSIQKTTPSKDPSIQNYADSYFGGDYNKAYQFLKNRGDVK